MDRPLKFPRRAWQRRQLRRDTTAATSISTNRPGKLPRRARGAASCYGQDSETEPSFSSDSESDEEQPHHQRPPARYVRQRVVLSDESTDSESSQESDVDSGYGSFEDLDSTADFYDDLLAQFEQEGPTLANHGENTKAMVREQEAKWKDDDERVKAAVFKVYLVWRVRNSRIKKESSVMTYWKVLSMVYSQTTASWMREDVIYDVRNVRAYGHDSACHAADILYWIHVYLTPTYSLDTSKKEKAGLFVEDLALLLSHYWIRDEEVFAHERLRVQLAANLILVGATATRSGALIGQLLYEHLEFQLFPPFEGERPRLVLKVNLQHIKRSGGKSEPKEFAFREDDMLLYDPLIPIMALAFAGDAFVNECKTPEDIYNLVVPGNSDRLRLRWKEEWLKRPIFRDVEVMDGIVRVSKTKSLQYPRERHHLVRLGRSVGLAKSLEWYDLRRGSGKKLNEHLTPEERNKIMGHRQGDSCPPSSTQIHDLIHLAGRLLRHGDAPTALTDQQKFEVNQDPKLVSYRQKRTKAMQQWKSRGFRSREDAKGTEMASRYDRYKKRADCLSKKLKAERLQQAIKDFHNAIHVEEINRQLNGIKPSTVLAPPTIEYELPERARVAALLSKVAERHSRDELFLLRLDLTKALTRLCKRRESPCRRQKTASRKPTDERNSDLSAVGCPNSLRPSRYTEDFVQPMMDASPAKSSFCPFCRWKDDEVGRTQRVKPWRIDSLARHIRSQHLKKVSVSFDCPYDTCAEELHGIEHFASHVARRHDLRLPPAIVSR